MASNSIIQCASSSRDLIRRYYVFVSFRGDTRNNFTDHLFGALRRKGIHFFSDVDDRKLKKGKHILPELLHAIDGSQIMVVVFSKKYASSKWCLRELEKIASCIRVLEKHVLPIFYDVTPSEVRNQSGDYKEAFDEYQQRFKEDKEKIKEVQRWREALSQVANLSGWDIGNKPQYGEIETIVQNIQKILQQNIVSSSNDDLVGIESRVEELEKLLVLDSVDDVLSLGICGMAGMGKTTLVAALCERIHSYFDFHYFIEDVSKICQNSNIFGLRKQLLCQAPEEKNLEIYNVFPRTNLVSHGRRLIVLDNVGHIDQLDKLALNHTCLGAGSRIMIISKDRRILEDYGVNPIYHVQPLDRYNAIQLFCKYAFKGNCVMSGYENLKYVIFSYIEGHPLLIKVLGRHLADQDVLQWHNAIARLRENPKKDILDKLRISFDGLEQNEKEIFLDIACFYHWFEHRDDVMEILESRGFEPESGLKILLEKSLITYYDETVACMPSLLIDLGKYIVKEESIKEPRKRSRLWDYQDLFKIMSDTKASEKLEAIIVVNRRKFSCTPMKADALSKMSRLKLLVLKEVKFSGCLNDLSNELAYLIWNEYPFKFLPPNFQPNNLVELHMCYSNIKQLWKGTKALPSLKCLDLSHSKKLVMMPDFEEAPNLEYLRFEGCIQLKEVHSSISVLRKLTFLDLKDCRCLIKMPDFGEALNLIWLNFEGCMQLREIHPSIGSLRELTCLNFKDCKCLVKMPDFGEALSLEVLNFEGCIQIRKIHSSISALGELISLKLKDCKSLVKMPDFGEGLNLEELNFEGCIQLREIHPSVGSLRELTSLNLKGCRNLISLPTSLLGLNPLEYLNLFGCSNLYSTRLLEESWLAKHFKKPFIRELDLSFCNLLQFPDAIGNLCCLEKLYLRGNKFEKIPSLKGISKLVYINLEHCKQLKYLFELPSQTDVIQLGKKGLYMFNSPKIVEGEEWSISWMIQLVKAEYHPWKLSFGYFPSLVKPIGRIESVIHGNEIPIWFNNQHVGIGNTISVDGTPLREDDNNWIGVAFCVVFCVSHHDKNSVPYDRPLPKTKRRICHFVPMLLDIDLVTDRSDHIYLCYFTRSYFIDICESWEIINSEGIEVEFKTAYPAWDFEVKKYGYSWIHEQDLQLPSMASKHRKKSSNRKHKFLKIKEKQ